MGAASAPLSRRPPAKAPAVTAPMPRAPVVRESADQRATEAALDPAANPELLTPAVLQRLQSQAGNAAEACERLDDEAKLDVVREAVSDALSA